MLSKYTDEYVGSLLREAVDAVLPTIVATYAAGYVTGQLVRGLQSRLYAYLDQ
jgi:hypothetical protein